MNRWIDGLQQAVTAGTIDGEAFGNRRTAGCSVVVETGLEAVRKVTDRGRGRQRFPDEISRARRSVLSRSLQDGTARTSQRHQEDDEQDAKARRHHATLDL